MQRSTKPNSFASELIRTPEDRSEPTASSASSKNYSAEESAPSRSDDQQKNELIVKIEKKNRWLSLVSLRWLSLVSLASKNWAKSGRRLSGGEHMSEYEARRFSILLTRHVYVR